MYFVLGDRDALLMSLPKGGRAIELGVYTGDHAARMLEVLEPEELHLVDYWRFEPDEHIPFPDVPAHFQELVQITRDYMGPDPNSKLEECYRQTVDRFAGDARVHIHRKRTAEAASQFDDGFFDLIYVDANHQYEYALRDLLDYAPKLKRGGVVIMNDHYDSHVGRKQNLGVIGATAAFMKRSDFRYVAMSSAPWSDLAITDDPGSDYCREFVDRLLLRDEHIVELPDHLVPNYTHKTVTRTDGSQRDLPSF